MTSIEEEYQRLLEEEARINADPYSYGGVQKEQPIADSGYYIPEFIGDQGGLVAPAKPTEIIPYHRESSGAEVDVNAPNAAWRLPSGQVVESAPVGFTGERHQAEVRAKYAPTAPESLPGSVFESIRAIALIKDPLTRAEAFSNAQQQAAQHEISIRTNTAKRIEEDQGVPRLIEAVAAAEAQDRRNPDPLLRQADSKLTQALRAQLDGQRARSSALVDEALSRNVTVQAMTTQLTMAKSVMDKSAAADQRLEEKQFQKDMATEGMKQQALLATSPQAISRALTLTPSLAGRPDEEIALYIQRQYRSNDDRMLLNAPTEQFLSIALEGSDARATSIFVKEESEKSGMSEEQVNEQLKRIRTIAQDPKKFDQIVPKALGLSADALKDFKRQVTTAITKEDKARVNSLKLSYAMAAQSKLAEGEFVNNVGAWAGDDPELAGAVNSVRQTTGKATAVSVLNAYVGDLQGRERVAKENEFYAKLQRKAELQNRSSLNSFDSFSVVARLQRERAQQLIEASGLGMISKLPLATSGLNPVAGVYSMVSDFFNVRE